jgi:hypothetical protein
MNFDSFFQAGFECSSHRRRDGVRLDLIRATGHDRHVVQDYRLCTELGFRTVRDGLRWHLIEQAPGRYDWSSWMPALEAAEEASVQVIWDLFHYGSPDHVDQAALDFPERFAEFALAALEVQQSVSRRPPLVCPLNEINFMSWAVEVGYFPRVGPKKVGWFKRQLVRTATTAARAMRCSGVSLWRARAAAARARWSPGASLRRNARTVSTEPSARTPGGAAARSSNWLFEGKTSERRVL